MQPFRWQRKARWYFEPGRDPAPTSLAASSFATCSGVSFNLGRCSQELRFVPRAPLALVLGAAKPIERDQRNGLAGSPPWRRFERVVAIARALYLAVARPRCGMVCARVPNALTRVSFSRVNTCLPGALQTTTDTPDCASGAPTSIRSRVERRIVGLVRAYRA